jgi:small neutral amino acid transporter SnatA (MarC family)
LNAVSFQHIPSCARGDLSRRQSTRLGAGFLRVDPRRDSRNSSHSRLASRKKFVFRSGVLAAVGGADPRVLWISIPVLRVAGGFIVAVSGWKLLSEGSQKEAEASADRVSRTDPLDQAFYPLTLPLTTGPGTIAVVISLGLSKVAYTNSTDELLFVLASLLAVVVIAVTIFLCFAYADRVQRLLGPGGTDVAVRLSAFILFCLGVQILWSGGSELLKSVIQSGALSSPG